MTGVRWFVWLWVFRRARRRGRGKGGDMGLTPSFVPPPPPPPPAGLSVRLVMQDDTPLSYFFMASAASRPASNLKSCVHPCKYDTLKGIYFLCFLGCLRDSPARDHVPNRKRQAVRHDLRLLCRWLHRSRPQSWVQQGDDRVRCRGNSPTSNLPGERNLY